MGEKSFQDVFKELRLERKKSQEAIAKDLEVSQSLINNWETNRSTPGPEMLEYIADYFNVSIDYLVGRTKYKNLEKDNTELDNVLFSKVRELSDKNKKVIINVVDAIKFGNANNDLKKDKKEQPK